MLLPVSSSTLTETGGTPTESARAKQLPLCIVIGNRMDFAICVTSGLETAYCFIILTCTSS